MAGEAKVKVLRVPNVQIEAVRNGYRLVVGKTTQTGFQIGSAILTYSASGCVWSTAEGKPAGKGAIRYEQASGEYVFPDFATLTVWMRKHIKHGAGVES